MGTVITVAAASTITPEVVAAFARLIPQLSSSNAPPGEVELAALVEAPGTTLLLATDDDSGAILGTLTLVVFRIPTGMRAWIEDVVVDDAARGRGVGEALTGEAKRLAVAATASSVELTSRPSREAANRLYQRLGFSIRDTNVYRWTP